MEQRSAHAKIIQMVHQADHVLKICQSGDLFLTGFKIVQIRNRAAGMGGKAAVSDMQLLAVSATEGYFGGQIGHGCVNQVRRDLKPSVVVGAALVHKLTEQFVVFELDTDFTQHPSAGLVDLIDVSVTKELKPIIVRFCYDFNPAFGAILSFMFTLV